VGSKAIVLWLAREGTYIREAKDARLAYERLLATINAVLEYDKEIEIWIEPKPNDAMEKLLALSAFAEPLALAAPKAAKKAK
jgi:xylose isomerase